MSTQIKHPLRLEIRLSEYEMETLDKISMERGIGKSEYIRTLLETDRHIHEKGRQITDEQVKRFMADVIELINNNKTDYQN